MRRPPSSFVKCILPAILMQAAATAATAATSSVYLSVNGKAGEVPLNVGDELNYSWSSTGDVASCAMHYSGPTSGTARLSSSNGTLATGKLSSSQIGTYTVRLSCQKNSGEALHSNTLKVPVIAAATLLTDMKINWPQPKKDKAYIVSFVSGNGDGRLSRYLRDGDGGNYILEDYWVKNFVPKLYSKWHYRITTSGVLEYADTICVSGSKKCKRGTYAAGYGIKWGSVQSIGDTVAGKIALSGSSAPFGYNSFTVKDIIPSLKIGQKLYQNVAKISLTQQICYANASFNSNLLGYGRAAEKNTPGLVACRYYDLFSVEYFFVPYIGFLRHNSTIERITPSRTTTTQPYFAEEANDWCYVDKTSMSCGK